MHVPNSFPEDELGFKWSVLEGKEKGSLSLMATAVPNKSRGGKFVVDKCIEFIDENGDREDKIIVKRTINQVFSLLQKK